MARPSLTLSIMSIVDARDFTFNQDTVKIGKLKSSDVRFDCPTVSRLHAVIEVHEEGYRVMDLGSLKGTRVNGVKVTAAVLKTGDVLQVGDIKMAVLLEKTESAPKPERKTQKPEMSPGYQSTPWTAFADSGMLWWVNRVLHPFGWVIAFEYGNPEGTGEPVRVYPARTTCRGFTPEVDDAGFAKFDAGLENDFRSR